MITELFSIARLDLFSGSLSVEVEADEEDNDGTLYEVELAILDPQDDIDEALSDADEVLALEGWRNSNAEWYYAGSGVWELPVVKTPR